MRLVVRYLNQAIDFEDLPGILSPGDLEAINALLYQSQHYVIGLDAAREHKEAGISADVKEGQSKISQKRESVSDVKSYFGSRIAIVL